MKKILSVIAILISIILSGFLISLNIIPSKYLILIIGMLVLVNVFEIFLLHRKNIVFKIFGLLLLIIVSICSGVGVYYLNNTNKLFASLTEVREENIYYVVALKDSSYGKLIDLNKKNIGTMKNDSTNYKKALKDIEKTIKISNKDYDNMFTMFTDLLSNDLNSVLINSNNYDIVCENNDEIKKNTKVIEKVSIEVIKEKEREYKNSKGTFNVLISGIDTKGDINKVSRSDVNIILTVNPNTHEILLTNIPRDMEVRLHNTTGLTDKLTHAGIYGVDMTRTTLEDFLETDIQYYVRVNFDSVVKIVDAIGGVDVQNDVTFSAGGRRFYAGTIHLNGKDALTYSRDRHHQKSGDWARGQHQMLVINAIINKITHSTELLTSYSELVDTIGSFVQTNYPDTEIKKQVKNQLNSMPSWKMYNSAVAGSGYDYQQTYSIPGMKLYVTHPQEESRAFSSRAINGMLKGKSYEEIK